MTDDGRRDDAGRDGTSPLDSPLGLTPSGDPAWRVLDRRTLLRTPRGLEVAVETVALPDGRVIDDYYQIEKANSVIVAPITDDGRLVVLRHYLHGARRVGLTFPGGMMEPGEDPADTARRELLEETGHAARAWERYGAFTRDANQGFGAETHFIARGVHRVAEPASGDLEEGEVLTMTPEALREALWRGEVPIIAHVAAMAMVLSLF